jgi:hypothetical protein
MFTNSMFESIKEALANDKQSSNEGWRQIMKTEKGKMYTVRLLPNVENPAKTFFHYYSHAWESFQTGQFINAFSPTTFQERDPIADYRFKAMRHGTADEQVKIEAIKRREQWMVNVYVESDPTNPENEGKVKILRYGRQLNKIIMDAIEGDDADQFGMKVFDPSASGSSLRIKVEEQGGYPTYVASKFLMPSEAKGLDPDEAYSNLHDLEAVNEVKSSVELQSLLDEHFHCIPPGSSTPGGTTATPQTKKVVEEEDDDIPFDSKSEDLDEDPLDDDVVKELLAGLDDA